jgi:integrase/recombinase XerD
MILKNKLKKMTCQSFDFKQFHQEMKIRGYRKKTIESYIYYNQRLLDFCEKRPLQVTSQDIKNFLESLLDKKRSRETLRLVYAALNCYYCSFLNKKVMATVRLPKKSKKRIVPLTKVEIINLIDNIENDKHKLLIELMFSAGLRVSEAVKIKIKDILVDEKTVFIRNGKGGKDRVSILSERFLEHFKEEIEKNKFRYTTDSYLFSGRQGHLTVRSVQMIIKRVAKKAKLTKKVYPHLLRHSFATELIKNKTDPKQLQDIMGHSDIRTTEQYVHIARDFSGVRSPLD